MRAKQLLCETSVDRQDSVRMLKPQLVPYREIILRRILL